MSFSAKEQALKNPSKMEGCLFNLGYIVSSDFAANRYFRQLGIFVQLCNNLEPQLVKAMDTVTKFFKEENDYLYKKGEEKRNNLIVKSLIIINRRQMLQEFR